jgi:uncharacterized protein (TIGR03086 family)
MLGVHVDPEEARMTGTPVDQLGTALDAAGELIAGITPEQWSRPTPCTDWDVRALVAHLSDGNHLFASALGNGASSPARARTQLAGATGNHDLVAAYRDSAEAVLAAFGRPGALGRTVEVPFGTVPGAVALHLRLTEVLVHGWDLAAATGQVAVFPEDLAEQELAFTRDALGGLPPGRSPFAPPTPAPDTAPALDRLAACLGRQLPGPEDAPADGS